MSREYDIDQRVNEILGMRVRGIPFDAVERERLQRERARLMRPERFTPSMIRDRDVQECRSLPTVTLKLPQGCQRGTTPP